MKDSTLGAKNTPSSQMACLVSSYRNDYYIWSCHI